MKRILTGLLATAGTLALTVTASAQSSNPYDLSGIDLQMEACTIEGSLQSAMMGATDPGMAFQAYADARADHTAAFRSSAAGQAFSRFISDFRAQRRTQLVYLAFNDENPTFNVFNGFDENGDPVPFAGGVFPDYIYTDEDKQVVLEQIETTYANFNIDFTLTEPAQGDYSTIEIGFNDQNSINLAGGILFGRAENIDFGNDVRNDNAFADASFWQLLAELDANFGTDNLEFFLGLEPGSADELDEINAVRQQAVVNQSANTAGHELGHILGLRHHDAFGGLGDGLPPARSPEEFIPTYELETDAIETFDHLMASGASAGLPLANPVLFDRFLSERSAGKLSINERRLVRDEERITRRNFPFAPLFGRNIANTLVMGENAGKRLRLMELVVDGAIDELGQEDSFIVVLRRGETFSTEIISNSDRTNEDSIWGKLKLEKVNFRGDDELIAENQVTFEGREPLIHDIEVERTGFYRITVSAPDSVPNAGTFVNLSDFGLYEEFGLGDYELYAYSLSARGRGGNALLAFLR